MTTESSTNNPDAGRVTLVGDDLTLVERIRSEAESARLLDRHAAADRLDLIAKDLASREQAVREQERAAWSLWLDTWLSAVTPTPPTVEAVADALRSGLRPFGIARGGA